MPNSIDMHPAFLRYLITVHILLLNKIYPHRKSNIIGYIRIYDALAANGDFENLRKFMMPVKSFPAMMPVIEAINNMRKQNLKIVLVGFDTVRRGQGHARSLGIVTMKDLVEELTGELAQW